VSGQVRGDKLRHLQPWREGNSFWGNFERGGSGLPGVASRPYRSIGRLEKNFDEIFGNFENSGVGVNWIDLRIEIFRNNVFGIHTEFPERG
jgi:hypothetical protein